MRLIKTFELYEVRDYYTELMELEFEDLLELTNLVDFSKKKKFERLVGSSCVIGNFGDFSGRFVKMGTVYTETDLGDGDSVIRDFRIYEMDDEYFLIDVFVEWSPSGETEEFFWKCDQWSGVERLVKDRLSIKGI
jgi:hypothetical protein